MHKLNKKWKIVIAVISILLIYVLTIFILPIPEYNSKEQYKLNDVEYELVTDNSIIDRLNNNFSIPIVYEKTIVREGVVLKVLHTSMDNNIIIRENVFGEDYYINKQFTLPDLSYENIEYITVNGENPRKLSGKDEIIELLSTDNTDSEILVKYKNISEEERLALDDLRQINAGDAYMANK